MKLILIPSRIFILFVFFLALISCASIGPKLLPKTRAAFNGSLITSDEQQLLLNIVRMRFEDRPYFMSVDSIISSQSLAVGGGANASYLPVSSASKSQTLVNSGAGSALTGESITDSFGLSNISSINAAAGFSDSPTITYTPFQGSKFATQLLSPISVPNILLLLGSGQSPETLFRIVMLRIMNYHNVPLINITKPPESMKFIRLVKLITKLQSDNIIYITAGTINKIHKSKTSSSVLNDSPPSPINEPVKSVSVEPEEPNILSVEPTQSIDIVVHRKYLHSPQAKLLYKSLMIKGNPHVIHMVDLGSLTSSRDYIIPFQQRNFLSMLYYLSNAVELTPDAIKQGLVQQIRYPNGKIYPLTEITKNILQIHLSNRQPIHNASVSVYYRNHWFYIADNDIKSKRTFALLQQIFNLQSGDQIAYKPVVTIPTK